MHARAGMQPGWPAARKESLYTHGQWPISSLTCIEKVDRHCGAPLFCAHVVATQCGCADIHDAGADAARHGGMGAVQRRCRWAGSKARREVPPVVVWDEQRCAAHLLRRQLVLLLQHAVQRPEVEAVDVAQPAWQGGGGGTPEQAWEKGGRARVLKQGWRGLRCAAGGLANSWPTALMVRCAR